MQQNRERTSPRIIADALLATVLAAVLASCGDTGDEAEQTTVTVPASRPVTVTATDFDFDPDTVVVRGEDTTGPVPIRITLQNSGSMVHNLTILRDGQEIADTEIISGEQAASLTTSLEPGTYQFICTVGEHADLGMVGELHVK